MKVVKYSRLSSSKLKYPVAEIIVGTIIKADGPFLRVKKA